MDKINVEVMQSAIKSLTEGVSALSSTISQINGVSDDITKAWKSTNSAVVKLYINEIAENVMSLGASISRIREKVDQVVQNTVTSDTVDITGGNGSSSLKNQSFS